MQSSRATFTAAVMLILVFTLPGLCAAVSSVGAVKDSGCHGHHNPLPPNHSCCYGTPQTTAVLVKACAPIIGEPTAMPFVAVDAALPGKANWMPPQKHSSSPPFLNLRI